MFPVCAQEIVASRDQVFYRDALEQFLTYGSYPELLNLPGADEKRQYLTTVVDGYLFRDILALQDVRNAKKMRDPSRHVGFIEAALNDVAQVAVEEARVGGQ